MDNQNHSLVVLEECFETFVKLTSEISETTILTIRGKSYIVVSGSRTFGNHCRLAL